MTQLRAAIPTRVALTIGILPLVKGKDHYLRLLLVGALLAVTAPSGGLAAVGADAQARAPAPTALVAGVQQCSASCAVAPGQTVSFAGGQFTVTNRGRATSVAGVGLTFMTVGPSMTASFDGATLIVSGVDVPNDRVAGCISVNGIPTEVQCVHPQGSLAFSIPPPNPAGSDCRGTPVPAGWNLVSGGVASRVNLNVGPLYTLPPGASDYQATSPSRDLPATGGYWVFFPTATNVYAGCGPRSFIIPRDTLQPSVVPTGAGWAMVGDPLPVDPVTVSGTDVLYTYDATQGYQEAAVLQPGQGAWAYSASGGDITFTPARP